MESSPWVRRVHSDSSSIARAAAIWRPLAPSQDALAVEGLAFLRTLFG